jgi:hypothetical protein
MKGGKKMNSNIDSAKKAFLARLKSLPALDFNDQETWKTIKENIGHSVRPEIEAQERLQNRSLSRLFQVIR